MAHPYQRIERKATVVHIKCDNHQKSFWIRQAAKAGMKLDDWVKKHLPQPPVEKD